MNKPLVVLSDLAVVVFFAYSIVGFLLWMALIELPVSFTKTLIPICFVPFFFYLFSRVLDKKLLTILIPLVFLILYAFVASYSYTENTSYVFKATSTEVRQFYFAVQSRWVMYLLLGGCFALSFLYSEVFFRIAVRWVWYVLALLSVYFLVTGFSVSSHIVETGAEKNNYRHVLSDWLAITGLFVFLLRIHSRLLVCGITLSGLIVIGGVASFFAFVGAALYSLHRWAGWRTRIILLFLLVLLITLFVLAGDDFFLVIGKEESLAARLYFMKTQFDFYWLNPIFGDFAGFYRVGPGTYSHNALSYLYSYGAIFFICYIFALVYIFFKVRRSVPLFLPLYVYALVLVAAAKAFTWGLDWFVIGFMLVVLIYNRSANNEVREHVVNPQSRPRACGEL